MKKRLINGLSVLLVLALALPCGMAAAEAGEGFPVTVTDHLGREVALERAPERLVSGYYITTSLLLALGLEDRLVGVEARAERFPIYAMVSPEIPALPNVGSAKAFDLEGCAALKPDLVILPVKLKDSIAALEALGIAVLGVEPEDTQGLYETIEMVGAATGTQARATALQADIADKYARLAEALEGVERPSVYFAGNSAYLNTAGGKMYQNTMIEAGGAQNVAAELDDSYWAEISYEQLLAWAPDVVLVAPGAGYTVEDMRQDEALAGLAALAEGRVYRMPDAVELWDAPLPSAVLGSLWIASVLHPEVYAPAEYEAEAVAFYQTFYGVDVSGLVR